MTHAGHRAYKKVDQKNRPCDLSVTIARWNDLSDKEKVDAIREAFYFNIDEKEWRKYSDSEKLKMLLGNTFVEWE